MPQIDAEKRVNVGFRLRPSAVTWLDTLAAEHKVTRTEVVKAIMAVAKRHEDEVRRSLT